MSQPVPAPRILWSRASVLVTLAVIAFAAGLVVDLWFAPSFKAALEDPLTWLLMGMLCAALAAVA